MEKYYFVCYEGKARYGSSRTRWNDVIDVSPMEFIKRVQKLENEIKTPNYYDLVVTFAIEITKEEFDKYDGTF